MDSSSYVILIESIPSPRLMSIRLRRYSISASDRSVSLRPSASNRYVLDLPSLTTGCGGGALGGGGDELLLLLLPVRSTAALIKAAIVRSTKLARGGRGRRVKGWFFVSKEKFNQWVGFLECIRLRQASRGKRGGAGMWGCRAGAGGWLLYRQQEQWAAAVVGCCGILSVGVVSNCVSFGRC